MNITTEVLSPCPSALLPQSHSAPRACVCACVVSGCRVRVRGRSRRARAPPSRSSPPSSRRDPRASSRILRRCESVLPRDPFLPCVTYPFFPYVTEILFLTSFFSFFSHSPILPHMAHFPSSYMSPAFFFEDSEFQDFCYHQPILATCHTSIFPISHRHFCFADVRH